jgi:hypothetical protein
LTELPFGQLAAGLIAGLLAVVSVFGLLRAKGPLVLVMLGLLVGIPLAGFAAYVIVPGREPDFDAMLLAGIPALIALGAAILVYSVIGVRRGPLTRRTVTILTTGTIVLWEGIVLALSIVLAQWQPVSAVANVAVNVLWLLLWIPKNTRRLNAESSVEIAAPRSRVFDFLAQPSNWPLFDEDLVSVAARPPAAIAAGSEIVQVSRYEAQVRGPRLLPDTVETTAVVTAVVPDESISTRASASPSTSELELRDTVTGSVLVARSRMEIPFRAAILGAVVVLMSQRSRRAARAARNLARLKEILEQA